MSTARGFTHVEATTKALPLYADACAGTLTSSKRSEEGTSSEGGARSASTLVSATRRGRMRSEAEHECAFSWRTVQDVSANVRSLLSAGHHAATLSLTTPSGSEAAARARLEQFLAVVRRRASDVSVLAVLSNDGKAARWHIHALVLGSRERPPTKFIVWWTRAGNKRAARVAQSAKVVGDHDVCHIVRHHLGRAMKPGAVSLTGPLGSAWARLLKLGRQAERPRQMVASKTPFSATKASTKLLQEDFILSPNECVWCTRPLAVRARRDCKAHEGCRQQSSRALCSLAVNHGESARQVAERLIAKRWSVLDSIHAARVAMELHVFGGFSEHDPVRLPAGPPTCSCSSPLARRLDAKTCGRSSCRTRIRRGLRGRVDSCRWIHLSDAQKRDRRNRRFFSTLLKTYRDTPFSRDDAARIAASFRVPPPDVDSMLHELVHEDGVVIAGHDGLRFVH